MAYMRGGGGGGQQTFSEYYHCYSTVMVGKSYDGDKILLPPSALDKLSRMSVDYPMLFELTNEAIPGSRSTHCGVLEFSAVEGKLHMPYWMMNSLWLEEGSLIKVRNVSLLKATFVKFQAQSVDFLEINNPKAVLEVTLRNFTCMTTGDMISIQYSGKTYELKVTEVRPDGKASIIETDCEVDFDAPVGYVEPTRVPAGAAASAAAEAKPVRVAQKATLKADDEGDKTVFKPFAGHAKRIDGKEVVEAKASAASSSSSSSSSSVSAAEAARAAALARFASKPAAGAAEAMPVVQPHKSKIGDQFSKNKKSVQAFTGAAHRFDA